MVSSNPQQAIPTTNQPFVNQPAMTITYPWYRLLLTLWNRTGGAGGDTSGLPATFNSPIGTVLTGTVLNAAALIRTGPSGDFTDTLDTAANYVSSHNFPVAPSTNFVVFINTTGFTWTIVPSSAIKFHGNLVNGNFQIPANSQRTMTIEIDSVSVPALQIFG